METISLLFKEPGNDCKKEWLLPRILKSMYIFTIVLIVVSATLSFLAPVFAVVNSRATAGEFLKEMLLLTVIVPIATVIALVWNRLAYEVGILIFRMFESEREIADRLEKLFEVQVAGNQYVCDRLAELSVDSSSSQE